MRDGWRQATIEGIAEVVVGGTPSTKEPRYWGGGYVWVTPTDITSLYGTVLTQSARKISQSGLEQSSAKLVPRGSTLVTTRATIGPAALAGVEVATNQGVTALVPKDGIDPRWLFYWVVANRQEFVTRGAGNTFPEVSRTKTRDIPITVPSMTEQRRIADLLGHVDALGDRVRRLEATITATHRATTFYSLAHGTRAQDPDQQESELGQMPAGWERKKLGELADVKGGKRLPKGNRFSETPTDYPYIRVVDLLKETVAAEDLEYLTPSDHETLRRYVIHSDDVYISIAGTIGRVGRVPRCLDGAHLTENAAKIVINDSTVLNPDFLVSYLASPTGCRQIDAKTVKTSQPKLALKRIKELLIPLPPITEQTEIASQRQQVAQAREAASDLAQRLVPLRAGLLHALLSGEHEIPESYDRFLDGREDDLDTAETLAA